MPGNFSSLPFTVTARPQDDHKYGGSCAANCYLTMPFNSRARVELENQGEHAYIQAGAGQATERVELSPDSITISTTSSIPSLTTRTSSTSMPCGKERTRPRGGRRPRFKPIRERLRSRTWTVKITTWFSRRKERETTSVATTQLRIFRV